MPQFAFIAKDRMGNTVHGKVEAADMAFAANQVGQMGYALLDLQPAVPIEQTQAMNPTALSGAQATTAFPAQPAANHPASAVPPGQVSNAPVPPQSPDSPAASSPNQAAMSADDILLADREKRRKVEMDLTRIGMKPDEIKRLLDANANTTAPQPGSVSPLSIAPTAMPAIAAPPAATGRGAVKQKLDARAADLHSFAAQLAATNAAKRTQEIEAVSLDLPALRLSTPQERQQAEPILREVYALKRREKYTEAIAKCREALNLVPSDAAALEMYGDLLQGVARTPEALAAYKRATEADAKRVSAEKKYGDLLMRQERWSSADPEAVPKNPTYATFLSLLIPGAGQLHNGERLKGAVLLALAACCIGYWIVLSRGTTTFLPSWEKKPAVSAPAPSKKVHVEWNAEMPVVGSVALYVSLLVFSAIDANIVARKGV